MPIGRPRPINPGEIGKKLAKSIKAVNKSAAKYKPRPGDDKPKP